MKIWFINQYNMPPEYGHYNRHFNFGKYLKRLGHSPTVFVGSFLHNTKIQMIKTGSILKKYENSSVDYYFVKTCDYSTSKLKRIYAMIEFYVNTIKGVKKFSKPDVILGSSAHPLAAIAAIKLAKRYNCLSIVEIRDLWPESLVGYGMINKNNPFLRLMYIGEKWIYNNADKLLFTMEGGKDYIIEKGWDTSNGGPIDIKKVYHINNGVDLEEFNYNKLHFQLEDDDLNNPTTFKVVYTGSIRTVNNVKRLVEIAEKIKMKNISDIKFLFYGDGVDRIQLEQYCIDNGLDNVIFKGFVDKKYIPFILSKSNLNIFHFRQNKIKKYGASLNKLFEYFASGRPTLSDCEFGYDLIKRYNCGVVIDNGNAQEMAREIINIRSFSSNEYKELCDNSLRAALDFDFKKLAGKFVDLVNGDKI